MFGGEAIERLGEDVARAFRPEAEESPDRHQETDTMTENRFLGEMAIVAAMHPPRLVAADGTGYVRVRRRDPESQRVVVEVGTDQTTADRSAQKLRQEQRVPPGEMRPANQLRTATTYLRSWIIKSAGEPVWFLRTPDEVSPV